jgi:beta-lactamase class A
MRRRQRNLPLHPALTLALALAFGICAGLAAAATSAGAERAAPAAPADNTAASPAAGRGGLAGRFEQIARAAQGRVGAAALVLETGAADAIAGDEHFPMLSVYKLPIALAVLRGVDEGRLHLDQQVPVAKADLVPVELHSRLRDEHPEGGAFRLDELLRLTVSESDGTSSDVLLRLAGGAGEAQEPTWPTTPPTNTATGPPPGP